MGLSGLEPPTSRLSGVRSNQLSYKPRVVKEKTDLALAASLAKYGPGPQPSDLAIGKPIALALAASLAKYGPGPQLGFGNLAYAKLP